MNMKTHRRWRLAQFRSDPIWETFRPTAQPGGNFSYADGHSQRLKWLWPKRCGILEWGNSRQTTKISKI